VRARAAKCVHRRLIFQAVIVQNAFFGLRSSLPPGKPGERSACLADFKDCQTNSGK